MSVIYACGVFEAWSQISTVLAVTFLHSRK